MANKHKPSTLYFNSEAYPFLNQLYTSLFRNINLEEVSVPLTLKLAHHISNKTVSFTYGSINPYYLEVLNDPTPLTLEQIIQTDNYLHDNGLDNPAFRVYPFSKTRFIRTLILNTTTFHTPFASTFLYDALKSQGFVKIIGQGVGIAVAFMPPTGNISEQFFNDYISSIVSSKTNYINTLEKELSFYQDAVNALKHERHQLTLEVERLNKQNYIYTQTTWR